MSLFDKALSDCPIRVQRLMLRLQRYDLRVTFVPGKLLVAADALSRATITKSTNNVQPSTEEPVELHVQMVA